MERRVVLTATPAWRRRLLKRVTALGGALAIIGAQLGAPHHGQVVWAPDRHGNPVEVLWSSKDPEAKQPIWLKDVGFFVLTSVFLTDTTGAKSWMVPNNINGATTIEGVGGGGGGGTRTSGPVQGGGGGAYAKISAVLTPLALCPYTAGAGGLGQIRTGGGDVNGTSGGVTTFNNGLMVADSGKYIPQTGGGTAQGGQAGASTGSTTFSGGNSGTFNGNTAGPGGGGAAGPNGAGSTGGGDTSTTGGSGGNADNSTVTGPAASTGVGANGNSGTEWTTAGVGTGAGGGNGSSNGGVGGLYGGGGGCGGFLASGGNGGQGIIVLTFTVVQITIRSNTTGSQSSALSQTVNAPAGLAQNDVILLWIFIYDSITGSPAFASPPSGWTQKLVTTNTSAAAAMYWYRATGSDPSSWTFNFTDSGSSVVSGYVAQAYIGVVQSGDPFDDAHIQTVSSTSNTSFTSPLITQASDMMVVMACNQGVTFLSGAFPDNTQNGGQQQLDASLVSSGVISLWVSHRFPSCADTPGISFFQNSFNFSSSSETSSVYCALKAQGAPAFSSAMARCNIGYGMIGTSAINADGLPTKIYWEGTINVAAFANACGVGIVQDQQLSAFSIPGNTRYGEGSHLFTLFGSGIVSGPSNASQLIGVSGILTFGQGDTVCVAWDRKNEFIWFSVIHNGVRGNWNGNTAADPGAGTNGIDCSLITLTAITKACCTFNTQGDQITMNFGNQPFLGLIPSGYTSYGLAGTAVTVDTKVPGEFRSTVVVDDVVPGEFASVVRTDDVVPGEFMLTVRSDDDVLGEFMETLVTDDVAPGESLSVVRVDDVVLGESLSVVRADELALGEFRLTMRADDVAPGEWLSVVRADDVAPGESLATVRADELALGEVMLTMRVDDVAPGETVLTVRADDVALGEVMRTMVSDGVAPGEWLSGVRADGVGLFEFKGVVVVTFDSAGPFEFAARVASDDVVTAEVMSTVRADGVATFEFTTTVRYDALSPAEALGKVLADLVAPYEVTQPGVGVTLPQLSTQLKSVLGQGIGAIGNTDLAPALTLGTTSLGEI